MRTAIKIFSIFTFSVLFNACGSNNPDDPGLNFFTIEDDKALGAEVKATIAANPQEYPILDPAQYPEAYGYLYAIRDRILNSGNVFYKDEFAWEIYIIHDDAVVNAFAAPGGYLYVYTGLIKFLQSEEQLAGVVGHEIAHADRRHSTDQLTKAYGIAVLLEVVVGENQGLLTEIAASLVTLDFSRAAEEEADEYSVRYLCPTEYEADGAADFFEMMEQAGGGNPPEFLSTHPNPGDRVVAIKQLADELNCTGTGTFDSRYQDFKNALP